MKRREPKPHQYIAAFAIATLLFFGGLWFGTYISYQKLDSVDSLSKNLQLTTLGSELQYKILSDQPCVALNSTVLTSELFEIGSRLDFMESELGVNNPKVLELKEFYHLLEIRHWLLMKKIKKDCAPNTNQILYFYSNGGDCPKCQEQGSILSYLHNKYPKINIYSFDINIKNPVMRTVKEIYGITSVPTLVINENKTGYSTSKQIEQSFS